MTTTATRPVPLALEKLQKLFSNRIPTQFICGVLRHVCLVSVIQRKTKLSHMWGPSTVTGRSSDRPHQNRGRRYKLSPLEFPARSPKCQSQRKQGNSFPQGFLRRRRAIHRDYRHNLDPPAGRRHYPVEARGKHLSRPGPEAYGGRVSKADEDRKLRIKRGRCVWRMSF